jgi:hypothetical protein
VEGALVWLEQNTARGPAGGGVQSVDGSWRLVYSTSTGLRFFQVGAQGCLAACKRVVAARGTTAHPFQPRPRRKPGPPLPPTPPHPNPKQYIPVKEDLVIDTASKAISLESELGPFRFVIGGAIGGWRPEGGELDFKFSSVDILLFGNKARPGVWGALRGLEGTGRCAVLRAPGPRDTPFNAGRVAGACRAVCTGAQPVPLPPPPPLAQIWTVNPTTKPKTYTFYFVGGRISAARSSAGGLSLLLK